VFSIGGSKDINKIGEGDLKTGARRGRRGTCDSSCELGVGLLDEALERGEG
jgi:hypothetical protein